MTTPCVCVCIFGCPGIWHISFFFEDKIKKKKKKLGTFRLCGVRRGYGMGQQEDNARMIEVYARSHGLIYGGGLELRQTVNLFRMRMRALKAEWPSIYFYFQWLSGATYVYSFMT